MGYIYKITNILNNKCYIGETKQNSVEFRWKQHIKLINKNKGGCPALKEAIKKYGLDNFKFEIIIICFDEDRFKFEEEYIKKYNSQVPNGYNILPGGIGGAGFLGKKHSKESIEKIVKNCKKFRENNPNHYETYREKHRESMKNVDLSSAVKNSPKFIKAMKERQKETYYCCPIIKSNSVKNSQKFISAVKEGRVGKANKDKNLLESTKEKIKDSLKKYYDENKDKKILKSNSRIINQYTQNNVFINQYISIASAGRITNINKSNISSALSGKNKTAGGFIWKYADKETK